MECTACGTVLDAPVPVGRLPLPRALLETEVEAAPNWEIGIAGCVGCGSLAVTNGPPTEAVRASVDRPSARTAAAIERVRHEATHVLQHIPLAVGETVVGIGAGDGALLQSFRDAGCEVVNIEPAASRRSISDAAGIVGIPEPLTAGAYRHLDALSVRSSLVLARTVLGRVDDPDQALHELSQVITRSGRIVVTLPDVESVLALSPPGAINPEWKWLWTPHALSLLALRHGMIIDHVDRVAMPQAWTCSLSFARKDSPFPLSRPNSLVRTQIERYVDRVDAWRRLLTGHVTRAVDGGRRVVAVGAGAAGITALNLAGLDAPMIDAIVDLNPFKQGRWAPGTDIPIHGVDALADGVATELLCLVPGLEPELRSQHGARLPGAVVRSIALRQA